jgi:lipid II:glycine glycyltransferase (peptidoglycan interpeptide bridge formation enzyme)
MTQEMERCRCPGKSASLRIINHLDDVTWDAFVAAAPAGHLLQTSRWGRLKAIFGWQVERLTIVAHQAVIGGAQVLYRSFFPGLTLAYVPKGPIVDWEAEPVVTALMTALRQAARRRAAFCLKVEPEIPLSSQFPGNSAVSGELPLTSALRRLGLRPSPQSIQPRTTLVIDLDGSDELLLARLRPKWRYNIRLAERKGVIVRAGSIDDLPVYQRLVQETTQRNAFAAYGVDYYRTAYELFAPLGQACLLVAEYQGVMLAGVMVFVTDRKAWYLYGASGNAHRDLMPSYLLQWRAMQWARGLGCLTYDLWGIPDEVGVAPEHYSHADIERKDGLWGVYRFKRGFGGRVVCTVGAYDDVYSRPIYRLVDQASAHLQRRWGDAWHRRLRSG